jgi:hypothetical protein
MTVEVVGVLKYIIKYTKSAFVGSCYLHSYEDAR